GYFANQYGSETGWYVCDENGEFSFGYNTTAIDVSLDQANLWVGGFRETIAPAGVPASFGSPAAVNDARSPAAVNDAQTIRARERVWEYYNENYEHGYLLYGTVNLEEHGFYACDEHGNVGILPLERIEIQLEEITELSKEKLPVPNTDLVSVAGVSVMPAQGWPADPESKIGFYSVRPYELTIELPAEEALAVISREMIDVGEDAVLTLYEDFSYKNAVSGINRKDDNSAWKEEVHAYILVTSGNGENFRYYDVAIREGLGQGSSVAYEFPIYANPQALSAVAGGFAPIMPLSDDINNPTERFVQLRPGETEYYVDMRPGIRGMIKLLYAATDGPDKFNDANLIASVYCTANDSFGVVEVIDPSRYPVPTPPGSKTTLYAKYVEDYGYEPTVDYYRLEIIGPPSDLEIFMESLAGQSTYPAEDGEGTETNPYKATIYVPLSKGSILNESTYEDGSVSDIKMTADGRRFLMRSSDFRGNTAREVTLEIGENHIYTSVISQQGTDITHYYDITVIRGFPFSKKANAISYAAGETLEYTMRLTLPKTMALYDDIRIVDTYPADKLSYVPGSANLSVGGQGLTAGTGYSVNDAVNGNEGVLTVAILADLDGYGDEEVVLTVSFTVAAGVTGEITNSAVALFDGLLGGQDEESIDQSNFQKDADETVYQAGKPLSYTISVTLPEDIGDKDAISITDYYPDSLSGATMTSLTIGGSTINAGTGGYALSTGTGTITVTLDRGNNGYNFSGDAGKVLVWKLSFTVNATATGTIRNYAEIEYDGELGGKDDEEVGQDDFLKDADIAAYTPGGELDYTISVSLPDAIGEKNVITITDTYPNSLSNPVVTSLTIGGG
ncbi:MAG: isopeptide-forming domain-containing fimbrial protein, partial [Clostridiales bacterium]|nr:isopeptide-forming domain-containing fimbrial protein [Clostridiales bacterium]